MFDDEYFSGSGSDSSGSTAPDTSASAWGDPDLADIGESIKIALGEEGSAQSWLSWAGGGGIENTAGYAQRQGVNDAPKAIDAASADKQGGILGKITSFVDKNKALSEMLIKGIAGAAGGNPAKAAAKSRLDELKLKNQQELDANARTSASVTGLRAPGIIGRAQQLKRNDGSLVFQNGRVV